MNKKNQPTLWIVLLIILLILTLAIFIISIFATNPTRLGPAGVTFWFINLLTMLVSILTFAMYLWRTHRHSDGRSRQNILQTSFRTGFLLAFCATILLALSSLRSLSWRDIILFLLTVILIELYFRTRRVEK